MTIALLQYARALVIVPITCAVSCQYGPLPQGIFVSPSVSDFGDVIDAPCVGGEFQIANTTRKPVRIVNVEPSCGCAEVQLSRWLIPSGETAFLTVRADTKGRYGPQVFSVLMMTDNGDWPVLRAQLVGRLTTTEVGGFIPFDIGACEPGGTIEEVIRIPAGKASSIDISDVRTSDDFDLTTECNDIVGGVVRCRLTGRAPVSVGDFTASVDLTADDRSDWKRQSIQIRGVVRSRWRYQSECYLGFIPIGSVGKEIIIVEDAFSHSPISQTNPIVAVNITSATDPMETDASWDNMGARIAVRYRGESPGQISERVRASLQTSDGNQHQIEIQVFGIVLGDD